MKSKIMKLFMLMFVVLMGVMTSITPVFATAGTWTTATSVVKEGMTFYKTVYSEQGNTGKVDYMDVKYTNDKFSISFPTVPLKGVVVGNVASVTTTAIIPVTITNPAHPSQKMVINIKATITEFTKKTGVWPFQKTVKSGAYAVVGYANLTNFKAFDKTYANVVANLRVYSNKVASPMFDSGLYYEKYNLMANPNHLASPAALDIKNSKFTMYREKALTSTTPVGFNFWLYSVNR